MRTKGSPKSRHRARVRQVSGKNVYAEPPPHFPARYHELLSTAEALILACDVQLELQLDNLGVVPRVYRFRLDDTFPAHEAQTPRAWVSWPPSEQELSDLRQTHGCGSDEMLCYVASTLRVGEGDDSHSVVLMCWATPEHVATNMYLVAGVSGFMGYQLDSRVPGLLKEVVARLHSEMSDFRAPIFDAWHHELRQQIQALELGPSMEEPVYRLVLEKSAARADSVLDRMRSSLHFKGKALDTKRIADLEELRKGADAVTRQANKKVEQAHRARELAERRAESLAQQLREARQDAHHLKTRFDNKKLAETGVSTRASAYAPSAAGQQCAAVLLQCKAFRGLAATSGAR